MVTRLRILDRKVVRDLWHMRGPSLAIAVVVLCGVASFVAMRSMVPHLSNAQTLYYRTARFADVWVSARRVPQSVAADVAQIAGVTTIDTRVTGEIVLDVPGLAEPANAHVIGMPISREAPLNRITIRSGRTLAPGGRDEVLVSEGFAVANGLAPGDSLGAVLNGRWRQLQIVGIALSPEYVLEMRGGEIFPDSRRYGILWIDEDAAAATFGMQGAWTDASLRLAPDASPRAVVAQVDAILARYGSLGAYARELQPSYRLLTDEIRQARTFATMMPVVFLGVAAFLVNIVLSRIVASQREQIGMLKSFGIGPWDLARHYTLIALGPVMLGAVTGTLLGLWLATKLASLYALYYRIPDAPLSIHGDVIVIACGISIAAAIAGAVSAVRRVVRLPAAIAMRPDAPAVFRAGIAERLRLTTWLSPVARMTLRTIERKPARAFIAVLGMAMAVAVMIVGMFQFDAIRRMRDMQFEEIQREDVTVMFVGPRSPDALNALARLPGVTRVEPVRSAAVRVQHEQRARQVGITGMPPDSRLRRLVDVRGTTHAIPGDGLLISAALAELLAVHVGDTVQVEMLTGDRGRARVRIGALIDDVVGMNAYLSAAALDRIAGTADAVDGALLSVDPAWRTAVYAQLKRTPGVGGVTARAALLENFDKLIDRSFSVTLTTLLLFAGALAIGVVYNTARIALSERGRELASLRVLGFTRREVASMLFGEQSVLAVLAVPVGFAIGTALCAVIIAGVSSELMRLPFVILGRTYLASVLLLLAAGIGSGLLVKRRLDRLDLVEVLKTRE